MNITSGKLLTALKVVVYGVEGIGKSTFAAQFPEPLFIDTEGSTKHLDVRRFDPPTSWQMLLSQVVYVRDNPGICKTLVIDTADWAQALALNDVLAMREDVHGIEDFGYGKGYVYVYERFGKLLNLLEEVVRKNTNVVLTAHARISKFEQPDEMGAYDRWSMKLQESPKASVTGMVKEWADMVLFANYKTLVVKDGKSDAAKSKAVGGQRVMYTTHHPCWDAKNRHGLPDELPFDFSKIAHLLPTAEKAAAELTRRAEAAGVKVTVDVNPTAPQPSPTAASAASTTSTAAPTPAANPAPANAAPTAPTADTHRAPQQYKPNIPPELPQALRDLMEHYGIDEIDIRTVVAQAGYKPFDMPIKDYGADFINGALIAGWERMLPKLRDISDLPF